MKNKVLTKKEQIEYIIDKYIEYKNFIKEIEGVLGSECEKFLDIYDIGENIIPAILEIPKKEVLIDYNLENKFTEISDYDFLADLFYDVVYEEITKEEYFEAIKDYLL